MEKLPKLILLLLFAILILGSCKKENAAIKINTNKSAVSSSSVKSSDTTSSEDFKKKALGIKYPKKIRAK